MFEQDYVMRQVQAMASAIAFFLLRKKPFQPDENASKAGTETTFSGGGDLNAKIRELLKEKKICEAEDLLFDRMSPGDRDTLETALDFYCELNKMDEDKLKEHGFSHDEIKTGLADITKRYGADIEGLFEL
jgi:hypothetical protein